MPRIRGIGGAVGREPFVLVVVLVLEESVFSCPVREPFWVQIVPRLFRVVAQNGSIEDENDDEDEYDVKSGRRERLASTLATQIRMV